MNYKFIFIIDKICLSKISFLKKSIEAFLEGIARLQRIINFNSIYYWSKKEIMTYLITFNITIPYWTLETDLKQIKYNIDIYIEYKNGHGYKYDISKFESNFISSKPNYHPNSKDLKLGLKQSCLK